MEKRSRRRCLLLRPLPTSPRIIFSHPHPLGKRGRQIPHPRPLGKRGRQIRRSAPMGNISELKSGRSRVISSSKVQTAASMSDNCEMQLDADPIQGAAGGPEQVSQVSNFEATRRGPSRPPLDLLNIPDEFKSLETDRLLPCDFENASSSAMQQYDDYLQWFYNSHRGPVPVASLADTASKFLEKQNSMVALWLDSHACSNAPDYSLSRCIYRHMRTVIQEKGEIEHPFAFDAAECLTKETELICEWLRHGRCIFTDDDYTLCHDIRSTAVKLFITRRKLSFHFSAALLGIRKEAERLIENLKCNSGASISTSMKIRQSALSFMLKKINELEPCDAGGNLKLSEVETASESDDDESDDDESDYDWSDDDVADDNNYVGFCYDEVYMKYCG